jgi:hypothetical protein
MALTQEQIDAEFQRRKSAFAAYRNSEEFTAYLQKRLEIYLACEKSSEAARMTYYLCQRPDNPKEGCKFFIENFGWTHDPRPEHYPHHLEFQLYDYQVEAIESLIDHIDNGKDLLIEKSRDMGVSWLAFVWVPIWYWLFRDGTNILVGSYKEALVDDKTVDSLFGKMDYSIRMLPEWMMPKGFRGDKHRIKLRLINPANGNQITGDTMNPRFGRGARKTVILFDELGFWDYAKESWESAGDSTSCRIANSTPNGYNYYALLKRSGMDVLTLHWSKHPHKDKEWYDFESARRTPEAVAQELDISYSKSREGRVYLEWSEENVDKGVFEYDPSLPLYVAWDFGKTDATAIIWAQKTNEGRLRIIDTYTNTGKNIDFYVPFITGSIRSIGYAYTDDELETIYDHATWKPAIHFGDPAGRFVNQVSEETVFTTLKNHGIYVNFKEMWKHFSIRKEKAKRLILDGIDLNMNIRNEHFDMQMINSAYPKVKVEGMEFFRTEKPRHDSTSHYRTAFEYLAMGLEDYKPTQVKPYDKFKKRSPSTTGIKAYRRGTSY